MHVLPYVLCQIAFVKLPYGFVNLSMEFNTYICVIFKSKLHFGCQNCCESNSVNVLSGLNFE